jgi:hypothetical protein
MKRGYLQPQLALAVFKGSQAREKKEMEHNIGVVSVHAQYRANAPSS